jgi:polyisoprenoid-binding protein YceI
MNRTFIFTSAMFMLTAIALKANAQLASTSTGTISFFSSTPVEDIQAQSAKVLGVVNLQTREIAFNVVNTSFEFPNKLMQEHFNEKYMESEKYPNSTFKGKINEAIDLTKDGEYKVTVTGKLNIHGVEQERTIPGTIIVKDGLVSIVTDFKVKVADHKIEIPKLVVAKIAEEIAVKLDVKLAPKK